MTVKVLRAADREAVAWKNGGGLTREIAAFPEGAGATGFDWRISLADVAGDGPFSAFPEVDRILTMAEGTGMDLTVGGERRLVDERYVPQHFPGDVATDCRLLGDPVVNLNVMYRRGRTAASVAVLRGGPHVEVPTGSTVVIVALDGTASFDGAPLARYDAVVTTSPGTLVTRGHAVVVTLTPTG
ncbi:HutD-family protein [Streptomyces agglomeratus]|uniref:HutD-family protein n=1 Tax=Streptomyces agglomeratus TaxID=285458 RepID=A0A1E5PCX9_9ACTN|nr:HutD family protein [Streptomyces agglomeratus]OEJ27345.1 HutD-family protein [Streptomyces agglomeratus]OEJ38600.1 HutD-family protein [Streptomyces agglomeratus]OEJ47015.1 HutD-family protein [Streptomyces agglomeratus]OEJ51127.1 HutD-family protein [Streptomyces agglomeratus]OEJ58496.1 HutD-family protein [Streptomyces agglomeratus]